MPTVDVGAVVTAGPRIVAIVENVSTESMAAEPDTCRRLDDNALKIISGNVQVYSLEGDTQVKSMHASLQV